MKKWIAGGTMLVLVGLGIYLGTVISPEALQAFLKDWGSWAPAGYIVLFAVLPVFFFPVAVLALAGGLLFGLWQGSIYTFLGAMINCTVMFFLARYVGREKIENLLQQKLSAQWREKLKNLDNDELGETPSQSGITDITDAFDTLVIGVRFHAAGRLKFVGMPIGG